MEHFDDSCNAYCPWLDDTPTSLRTIDSHTQPRQRVIPKKMKKLIDGDLAAISGKRKGTKDRLKEKLRQKQEANDQHLQAIGNKDVALPSDVEQKSGKQKKRRKRSKKAPALDKQENEAKNEDSKQVESTDKIEVEESSKKPDGEASAPVDNRADAETAKPDGEFPVPINDKINADTLLSEMEKLKEEISILVNNEVNVETLLAEIEKFNLGISEPIDNEINADIHLTETERLSEEISVSINYELNANTLLTEIKKLDGEISESTDSKLNADRLLAGIEQLSEEISVLFDNEENTHSLLAETEILSREISEPVEVQSNADTCLLEDEKPDVQLTELIDKKTDADTLSADTEKFSGERTETVNASTLWVEKPNEEISKLSDITENGDSPIAEINNFRRDIAEPLDNRVNALLTDKEKAVGDISVCTDNADTLLAEIEKLREEVLNLVNKYINADTLIAETQKLGGEITELTDKAANADKILAEIEKTRREISEPTDVDRYIDTLLTEIKMLDDEISVQMDNKVNAETLSSDIEKLSENISELIDNEENADAFLAEIENLNRALSEPHERKMNADLFSAEAQKPDVEFTVSIGNQEDADTLSADIKEPDIEIVVPSNNITSANTLLTETSVSLEIKINAYTMLDEIEKLSEEVSELVDSKTKMDTLLAETEKLNREISEPIDNKLNNDIPLAEVKKFGGTNTVPVYNKVNPGTLLAEIQKLKGDIPVPVDKDWEISALHDIKLNAYALLAASKDKTTRAAHGESKKFTFSGQFRQRIDPEKYSIVADKLYNKLRRNNKVEISMSERKNLIGNMKSEVELLRKNVEILFMGVLKRLKVNKVDILSPEKINCLDVATTARQGCENDFELYSVIPSKPSNTEQQLAASHSRPGSMLIKGAHQEVLHTHFDISKEKTYTCQENVEQKSLTQKIIQQSPLVNENSVREVKYCPVSSISQVISDSTQNMRIISNTEIKEKKRFLVHNLMEFQTLRDRFSKVIIRVQDVWKIGLLFMEALNKMRKMTKISLEVVNLPDVSNSVLKAKIGLGRLFILCCDSGPGLCDFIAAMKINGLTNNCISEGITCSTEKFLPAWMRQRFVLAIFFSSTTGRSALHNAICSWADPVDFTQSDLRIYSTVVEKESTLNEVKPWIKMKTGNIINIYSIFKNIRMRQKSASVQMVELCRKANMLGSEITFESHYDKMQLPVSDVGQVNYTNMPNNMVSKYIYSQGQQGVFPALETTNSSQRGLKAQFMCFKIPTAMTGCLIKPIVVNGFMENAANVHNFEDLDGPAGLKNLIEMNILQNKVSLHVKEGITNIQGKMADTDFEFKIREKSKFNTSLAQICKFPLNKKVKARVACEKRQENVQEATFSTVNNVLVSQKKKNLTLKCYDDGLKEIEKYIACDGQTVTRSATEIKATETTRKYIVRLHEQISNKLTVKGEVKLQTETVKILQLNLEVFPCNDKKHEKLKLRNRDRSVTAETVQESSDNAVESLSTDGNNTTCSQINDEAPGQIYEHSENINTINNLEQTHYGIRLCMFD